MKISKLLLIVLMSLFVYLEAAEFDDDISSKGGLALKQYAQMLKNNAAQPHHAALKGTDTELLIKAAYYHDNHEYLAYVKKKIIDLVRDWIKNLADCDENSEFLDILTPIRINHKVVMKSIKFSKKNFIEALTQIINMVISDDVPNSPRIRDLKACNNAVIQKIITTFAVYINGLSENANNKLLLQPFGRNAYMLPVGQTNKAFSDAISFLIKSLMMI